MNTNLKKTNKGNDSTKVIRLNVCRCANDVKYCGMYVSVVCFSRHELKTQPLMCNIDTDSASPVWISSHLCDWCIYGNQ